MYPKLNLDSVPCASDIWYKFSELHRKTSGTGWIHL